MTDCQVHGSWTSTLPLLDNTMYTLQNCKSMTEYNKVYFRLVLKKEDQLKGSKSMKWACPLLSVPGVKVIRVEVREGKPLDTSMYSVQPWGILYKGDYYSCLDEITVVVEMSTQQLAFKSGEDKWKLSTSILSVITAALTLIIIPLGRTYIERQSWFPPPQASTQVSPSPGKSGSPSSQAKNPKPQNPYNDLKQYPAWKEKGGCGGLHMSKTTDSGNIQIYYPVFIPGKYSLEKARDFCKDAQMKYDYSEIQIASFTDKEQADLFVEFIQKHFPGARRGKPS
jgi:hypothetical protein